MLFLNLTNFLRNILFYFSIIVFCIFQRPKAAMPYKPGFEEDGFLRSLAPLEPKDIELKAENCTKVRFLINMYAASVEQYNEEVLYMYLKQSSIFLKMIAN